MRAAIVDHGIPLVNGAEGFDWLLGALDPHELHIWRAIALNHNPPNAPGIHLKRTASLQVRQKTEI